MYLSQDELKEEGEKGCGKILLDYLTATWSHHNPLLCFSFWGKKNSKSLFSSVLAYKP